MCWSLCHSCAVQRVQPQWLPVTSVKSCSCIHGSAWVWLIRTGLNSKQACSAQVCSEKSPSSGTRRSPGASCSRGHSRSESVQAHSSAIFLSLMSHLLISSWPKWAICMAKSWCKARWTPPTTVKREVSTRWAMMQTSAQNDVIFLSNLGGIRER